MVFEQVYGVFQDFHAYFVRCLAAGKRGTTAAIISRPCWGPWSGGRESVETVPASARVMQVSCSAWDDDAVIGRLQEYLSPRLGHPEAVWVLDGSDFPKQGRKSAGVARQYCGRLGKVAGCQAGMFLAYVSPLGRALVDKRLYLPESWTSDKDRCEAAGVPEERQGYRSKTQLALKMVERALERGHLRAGWVVGDDAFGMSQSFREGLAALGMRYVLDVPGGTTVWPLEPAWTSPEHQGTGRPRKPRLVGGQRRTMEERSDELPEEAWREITVAEGSQGPRSYLFSAQRVRGSPAKSTGPSTAGTWTAASPATICPTPRRPHPWRRWLTWAVPGALKRSSRQKRAMWDWMSTRPGLGRLASPYRPMPAGRSVSPEPAAGLGGKRCPGSPARKCTGWCGRCCPGNGSGRLNCCGGWRRRKNATSGPDAPMPSVEPPFVPPYTPLLEPSL